MNKYGRQASLNFLFRISQHARAHTNLQVAVLLTSLVYCLEERTAHKAPLGQRERLEALSPRETEPGNDGADSISRGSYVQVDGHRLWLARVDIASTAVKVNHVAHFLSVGALDDPVMAIEGLGVAEDKNTIGKLDWIDHMHFCNRDLPNHVQQSGFG